MWRGLPLAEKVGVCRQTRVAEATPSRSSRSRRDKPQGLAPFPATGQAEVWGTFYLWRVRDAGHSRLRSRISKLAFLFVRVGDELSACGRWSDRPETLSSRPSAAKSRDGTILLNRDFRSDRRAEPEDGRGSGRVVADLLARMPPPVSRLADARRPGVWEEGWLPSPISASLRRG